MAMEPAPVPAAGETLNQLVAVEADQVRVPVPEFEIATLWAAGLELPAVPAKVRDFDATLKEGMDGAARVRVTATVAGDPVAPAAFTVTDPV